MVHAKVQYKPNPRLHPDGIAGHYGSSQDSCIVYDATNDEFTVQTKDAGGTLQDRLRIEANTNTPDLDLVSNPIKWTAGRAVTAGDYSIARDADGTNQLHLNVPTGAGFEFSVNDVAKATLSASAFDLASGNTYQIAGTDVLTASALGSGVVGSSLTSVGTLTSLTVDGAVTVSTADGIDVNLGSDADADLITVGVTGTPKIYWDESEDEFRIDVVGLIIPNQRYLQSLNVAGDTVENLIGINGSDEIGIGNAQGFPVSINEIHVGGAFAASGSRYASFTNGTAPGNPGTNSALIYAKDVSASSEMFAKGEDGTESQISPHPADFLETLDPTYALPWAHQAMNPYIGKEIKVDMYGVVKAVEELLAAAGTPKSLIYIRDLDAAEKRDWYADQEERREMWNKRRAADKKDGLPDIGPFPFKHAPKWLQDRGVRRETAAERAARGL